MQLKYRLALFAVSILAMSVMATNAYATSAYDDVFHQGNFLVNHGNCTADAATLWSSAINDPDKWVSSTNQSTIASHFATALSNETGWAVIQREAKAAHSVGNEDFAVGDHYLTVLISANSSTELSFTTNGDYGKVLLPNTSVDVVQMALTGGSESQPCEFKVIGSGVYQSAAYSPFGMEDNNSYVFNSLVRYDQVLVNFTINYPTGYEGELIPTEAPPAKYVAMGDSFSSGEGNAPFELGTDESEVDECHRSSMAYPRLLEFDSNLNLGSTAFVACSGSTTKDVLGESENDDPHGKWDEPAQIDALSEDTDVVTITIGGNDVGFPDFVAGCMFSLCGYGTPAYNSITDKITDSDFSDDLKGTYLTILEQAPSAELYVVNYPYIVKDRSEEDCTVFPGGLTSNDEAAEEVTTLLNATILNAYLDIKQNVEWSEYASRLHYIEVNYSESPFEDRDLCGEDPEDAYFYRLDLYDPFNPKSFHPTENGQNAYKEVVKEEIS